MLAGQDKRFMQVIACAYILSLACTFAASVVLLTRASLKAVKILNKISGVLQILATVAMIILIGNQVLKHLTEKINVQSTKATTQQNAAFLGEGQTLKRRYISQQNIHRAAIICMTTYSATAITSIIMMLAGGPIQAAGIIHTVALGLELIGAVLFTVNFFKTPTQQDLEDQKKQLNTTQQHLSKVANICGFAFLFSMFVQNITSLSGSVKTAQIMEVVTLTFLFIGGVCMIASWHNWEKKLAEPNQNNTENKPGQETLRVKRCAMFEPKTKANNTTATHTGDKGTVAVT